MLQGTRSFFTLTLARVATPFREVSWADFLLADFLTSLAKPLSDGEHAVCHLITGSVMDPNPSVRLLDWFFFSVGFFDWISSRLIFFRPVSE